MKWITTFLTILLATPVYSQFYAPLFPDQKGEELLISLVREYKPSSVLSLASAKDIIYSEI